MKLHYSLLWLIWALPSFCLLYFPGAFNCIAENSYGTTEDSIYIGLDPWISIYDTNQGESNPPDDGHILGSLGNTALLCTVYNAPPAARVSHTSFWWIDWLIDSLIDWLIVIKYRVIQKKRNKMQKTRCKSINQSINQKDVWLIDWLLD